jgi:hypothetical protein
MCECEETPAVETPAEIPEPSPQPSPASSIGSSIESSSPEPLVEVVERLRALDSRLSELKPGSRDQNRIGGALSNLVNRTVAAIDELRAAEDDARPKKRAYAIAMVVELLGAVRDSVYTHIFDGPFTEEFNACVTEFGEPLGEAVKLVVGY